MSRFAALLLGLVLPACSAEPEVVGHQSKDPYFNLPTIEECKPGKYAGTFATLPLEDGGKQLVELQGTMSFTLELSSAGDVLSLRDDAHLSGTTSLPFPGEIESDLVATQPCTNGGIVTEFRNGVFTSTQGTVLQFTGSTFGSYEPERRIFSGFWGTSIDIPGAAEPLQLLGSWTALWAAPPL